MILESSVPFNINRPLTTEEFDDVLNYCAYDVDMTIEIFKKGIKSYFKPKISLVGMLKNEDAMKWNTTTISAQCAVEKNLGQNGQIFRIEEWMLHLCRLK